MATGYTLSFSDLQYPSEARFDDVELLRFTDLLQFIDVAIILSVPTKRKKCKTNGVDP